MTFNQQFNLLDSLVVEEPNLQSEEQEQQSVKVDLNNYLHPFDVRCDKNGVLRVYQPEKRLKQVNKLTISSKKENDLDVKSVDSFISSVPSSFFETPRVDPLRDLKMIDLTLGANDNQLALRAYLVDWLTESLMNAKVENGKFPKDFDFPKFGDSPNSTPTMTPPPQEEKQVSFDDEDDLVGRYTAEEKAQLEKLFADKVQIELTDELMEEYDIENKKPKDKYTPPTSKINTKESETQTRKSDLMKPKESLNARKDSFEYKIKDFQAQKPIERIPRPLPPPKDPIKLQVGCVNSIKLSNAFCLVRPF